MNSNFANLLRAPDGIEKYLRGGVAIPPEMPGRDYWHSEYAKDPEQAAQLFELELAFNKFAFRKSNQHTWRGHWRSAYEDDRAAALREFETAKGKSTIPNNFTSPPNRKGTR